MRLFAVRTDIVQIGQDMTELILESLKAQSLRLEDGDILALTSKIVAYSEGRIIKLGGLKPSEEAKKLARIFSLKSEFAELILREADEIFFRNNLILGWQPSEAIFSIDTFTNYTSSDYNGFHPDPAVENSFVWKSPPFDIPRDYNGLRVERKCTTRAEYSQATDQDHNSMLVDYDIFRKVVKVDPNDITRIYKPEDFDFRLKPGAIAIDAGCILPNINDGYTGRAPDLGALEVHQPIPIYGPRPE